MHNSSSTPPDTLGFDWDMTLPEDVVQSENSRVSKAKLTQQTKAENNKIFLDAITTKNVSLVRECLKNGASVEQKIDGTFFEIWAYHRFDVAVMDVLCEHGLKPLRLSSLIDMALANEDHAMANWALRKFDEFDVDQSKFSADHISTFESVLLSAVYTDKDFGLDVLVQAIKMHPNLILASEAAALEYEEDPRYRTTADMQSRALQIALRTDHTGWMETFAKMPPKDRLHVWDCWMNAELGFTTFEQCANLSKMLKTYPHMMVEFNQTLFDPKTFAEGFENPELMTPQQKKYHDKQMASNRQDEIVDNKLLGWTMQNVLNAEKAPTSFFQALLREGSPAVVSACKTAAGRAAFDQALGSSPETAHAFVENSKPDAVFKLLDIHPNLINWTDDLGNSLGHHLLAKSPDQTKKRMLEMLKIAPHWFEVQNTKGNTLMSFLKWSFGDTEALKATISQKMMKKTLFDAGLTHKKSKEAKGATKAGPRRRM